MNFAAQPGDVHVHRPGLHEAVRPQTRSSSSSRPNTRPGVPDEDGEQIELLAGELDQAALHLDLEAMPVDLELAGLEVVPGLGLRSAGARAAMTARTRASSSRGENGLVT